MAVKLSKISQFKKNTKIQGFFLVREKYIRSTRNHHPYLQLILQDRTGTIEAKVWEDVPAFEKSFDQGDAVVVKGRVSEYREQLQLEIEDIGRATAEKHAAYGFDPMDLLPSTDQDIEEMWTQLLAIIETMENPFAKQLVRELYLAHEERIKTHPASMVLHHAVYGGYLEHVLSMAQIADPLAGHYKLDRDLLLAGVFLHDMGKLIELHPVNQPGYTDEGTLLGHLVLGRDMVRDAIKDIQGFPSDLQLKIEHMILSHQGKYEWQSPKQPKFPEAQLLHHIDEIDARMNMMREAIAKDQEPGSWTNRFNYFRLSLLKGPLKGED